MREILFTTDNENHVWFLNRIGALERTWEQIEWLCDNGFEEWVITHIPTEFKLDASVEQVGGGYTDHPYGDTTAREHHPDEFEIEVYYGDKWYMVDVEVEL